MTTRNTDTESIVARSLRHAAGLVELYGIQPLEIVNVGVDRWGDVDMHLEWNEFDRIIAVAGVTPERVMQHEDAHGNTHRRFVHHGVAWCCLKRAAEQVEGE